MNRLLVFIEIEAKKSKWPTKKNSFSNSANSQYFFTKLSWIGPLASRLECIYYPNTTMGFCQCLPFSWTTLTGKHSWHPIAMMGIVDTFGLGLIDFGILEKTSSKLICTQLYIIDGPHSIY